MIDRFVLWLGRALAWVFLAIALMITFEVVSRYGFNAPTYWAHELAGILAAIAFLFGGAYCMSERSHLRIGLFIDMAPRPMRRAAEVVSLLCGAIFTLGLTVAGWDLVGRSLWRFGPDGSWTPETSGTSWNTPMPAFIKLAMCVAAALFLIVIAQRFVALVRGTGDATPR
ncbi:MAG: TRAP transporter small permease [Pseudomonadota bacterium]